MRRSLIVLSLVLAACSSGEPIFQKTDLPRLVLQTNQAPVRTRLDVSQSGERALARASNSALLRQRLKAAGFITGYLNQFVSPELFTDPVKGSLAISFGWLFGSPAGATEGLRALETDLRSRSSTLDQVSARGLGSQSFAFFGDIAPRGLPGGFFYAWRVGNGVFGLVAAGPEGGTFIYENAARALADEMAARAR